MTKLHMTVSMAVVASALLASGCTSAAALSNFNQINTAFSAVKSDSKVAANAALPAAAIATTLGGIAMVKELSSSLRGGKIITSSGSNLTGSNGAAIVSAGGGNISGGLQPGGNVPSFHVEDDNAQDKDITDTTNKIALHVKYSSTTNADGSTTSAINSCTGTSEGYTINANGQFNYTPNADGTGGSVACSMTGSVSYQTLSLSIKTLKFACADPLPNNTDVGNLDFEENNNGVKASLTASLHIDDSGKLTAAGSYAGADGKATPLNFDENSPSGLSAGADATATGS